MTPADFPAFYAAVHGYEPFPWQQRLAGELLAGRWPRTLALPTSSGKTSVIDAVVFALASQADRPAAQRTVPLRACFVVDRRLVVDEAARHAHRLAEQLAGASTGIVAEVAGRLRRFGAPAPLAVATLRGGIVLDDAWAARPNQPAVIATTVDQAGSRLLFRGYGLSPYQWPVHAGLLGNDALFVIDEAHLSQPFLDTLAAVERFRTWAETPVAAPFRVLVMSATPVDPTGVFALNPDDRHHKVLRPRLTAAKPARLVPPTLTRFKQTPGQFDGTIIAEARRLAAAAGVQIVGVVVNRVNTARQVFEALRGQHDALLLTGRIRPADRDRLLEQWLPGIKASRAAEPAQTLFVVATQTVEVGADISFDALVTETAPLSALRQRAGRLDRLGRRGLSPMVIVLRDGDDLVYGGRLARNTHEWLIDHAAEGVIDFGVQALDDRLASASRPPPAAPEQRAPVLLPAILEQWAQTSPAPHPNPDVAPYLHGPQRPSLDIQVVWRADLVEGDEDHWAGIVGLLPPGVREALPAPLPAFLAWLRREEPPAVSDLEGTEAPPVVPAGERRVLRWAGVDSAVIPARDLRPGDTVVVPAAWGGGDDYGWHPDSLAPVADIAERCQRGRSMRVRLHPALLAHGLEEEQRAPVGEALRAYLGALADPDACADLDAVRDRLLLACRPLLDRFGLALRRARVTPYPGDPPAGVVVSAGALITDEDDVSVLTRPVALPVHLDGVGEWSGRLAAQCGLPAALVADERLAGRWHDLGKAEPRFQTMLYGGDECAAAAGGPLAKSGLNPADRSAFRRARERSGLPVGWRHEFLSAALLADAALASARDPALVRYLVGVHHGRGRPWPPAVADSDPSRVTVTYHDLHWEGPSDHPLARVDGGWAELFWALNRRYGYWGLAYLEALLRLADRARSQEEVEHG